MKHIVIHKFRDLQDKTGRVYKVGDEYVGKKTEKRIEELTSKNNKIGVPLIAEVEEEEPDERPSVGADESEAGDLDE